MKKAKRGYLLVGALSAACLATGGISHFGLASKSFKIEEMKWELERVRLRVKDLVAQEYQRSSETSPKWKIVSEGNMSEVLEWIEISSGESEVAIESVRTTEESAFARFEFRLSGRGELAGIVKFLAALEEYQGGLVLEDLVVSASANANPTFKLQVASYFGADDEHEKEDK